MPTPSYSRASSSARNSRLVVFIFMETGPAIARYEYRLFPRMMCVVICTTEFQKALTDCG